MIITLGKNCDIVMVDIDEQTVNTITEFSHSERAEFRKCMAEFVPKLAQKIIDNPILKGL